MKRISFTFIFIGLSQFLLAQQALDSIIINNVKGYITNDGSVFTKNNTAPGFEAPIGSGKTTIYSSGIWIGALDAGNNLHVAASFYNQLGFDFGCGPSSSANVSQAAFYDKIYKITKDEVVYHLLHYNDSGYITPANISNWPANGRTQYNEPQKLAPFNDKNGNTIYEPSQGEVPVFPGDVATLCIYNDNRVHDISNGDKLNVDIYQFVYGYKSSDSALANTLFVNYRIVNRSGTNYNKLYLGQFADFDLGNFTDDIVACDPSLNLYYSFNGDDHDEGVNGYGLNPPAMGCLFLNKDMSSSMYFENDLSNLGNPATPSHYYNSMQAKWHDGVKLTSDTCTGYGGNQTSNYFPTCNLNIPTDKRVMGSIGPFNFNSKDELCYTLAYVFARGDSGSFSSVTLLKERVKTLKQMYISTAIEDACNPKAFAGVTSPNRTELLFEIFPNPANDFVTIKYHHDILDNIIIYDIAGKVMYQNLLKPRSEITVNTSNLAAGVYIISVGDTKMKLVKQ